LQTVLDNNIQNGGNEQINDEQARANTAFFKTGSVDEWMDYGKKCKLGNQFQEAGFNKE
jgi:glucose-1-phosphate thymidylyltransferase